MLDWEGVMEGWPGSGNGIEGDLETPNGKLEKGVTPGGQIGLGFHPG